MNDLDKLAMILRDNFLRASRHRRATDARKYLLMDLDYIELQTAEALQILGRLKAETKSSG